jgi:DNA-binding transcriptional LysR family regulator
MVSELQAEPKGILRINALMSFGTLYLGKAITKFSAQYPELGNLLVETSL